MDNSWLFLFLFIDLLIYFVTKISIPAGQAAFLPKFRVKLNRDVQHMCNVFHKQPVDSSEWQQFKYL